MPRLSKIPERLHDEIKKKVGENVPASVIADWLGKEHNITISRQGISLFIKQWKEDRSAAAKVAYANAAAEHANIDITVIGDVILKFKEKVDKALIAEDYNTATRMADVLLKYIKTRLELSGVNEELSNTESEIIRVREEWVKKLDGNK